MSRMFAGRCLLACVVMAAACSAAAALAQERFVLSEDRVCQSSGGLAVNPRSKQIALWMHAADAAGEPDSRHVAVFDIETRRLVKRIPPPVGVQHSWLAFAPDGSALASSENGSLLRVWNAETWEENILWEDERKRVRNGRANSQDRPLAYSINGDAVALIGVPTRDEGEVIYVVDARSGELRTTIEPPGMVHDIAFSLDESCLAVSMTNPKRRAAGIRGKIELWDVRTSRRISTLHEEVGPLRIEISPRRDVMATIGPAPDQGNPPLLKLWRLSERPAKSDFSRFQASALDCGCAAFSPSGALLAVGHSPPARRVTVYVVATGAVRCTLDHDGGFGIADVAFAGEDVLIATVHRLPREKAPTVLVWKLPH